MDFAFPSPYLVDIDPFMIGHKQHFNEGEVPS